MYLINPQFSFLQFGVPFDTIPVREEEDLKFQVRVDFDTEDEAAKFVTKDALLHLVTPNGAINAPADLQQFLIVDYKAAYSQQPSVHRIGRKRALVYWGLPLTDLHQHIQPGKCFRICLQLYDDSIQADTYFTSNTIIRVGMERPTSVLEYFCDEDAYDFVYCLAFVPNRFRLPLYISRPQFQDEEKVYVRSDGTRKLLMSVTKKEYEGFVELLTVDWHERIKQALSHDHVYIDSVRYQGGISKSGNYEIEWPEFMDFQAGPATFKVLATPYNWRNSNCAECEPLDLTTGGSCALQVVNLAVGDGPLVNGIHTYEAVWQNAGGIPHSVIIEISYDNGTNWLVVNGATRINDTTWTYDLGGATPVIHKTRVTPKCDALTAGQPGTADYLNIPCGTPENVTFSAVNNGDGTQTITVNFDPLPYSTALTISRSTDGVTFIGNSTGAPAGPRQYLAPLGIFTIKLTSHGTCAAEKTYPNIGTL